jgi:hypothetical protein
MTFGGAIWLSVDAFLIRRHIRSEAGSKELLNILKKADAGGGGAVTDKKTGKPLDSNKALQLWFARRTVAWNWIALTIITIGFLLDLIGKLKP